MSIYQVLRMKKFIILCILLLRTFIVSAYDINVDGIRYNFTSDSTVAVTYIFYLQYNDEYRGDMVVPASITHDGKTYAVTSIGKMAFYFCRFLNSVTLPTSITKIEDDAFCKSSIVTIKIPDGVTELRGNVFANCSYLKSIQLPPSFTRISSTHIITNCLQLEEIECRAIVPPVFENKEIDNYILKKCTLKVPKESVDACRSAIGWKECKKIVTI